jgi:hypothetical protein
MPKTPQGDGNVREREKSEENANKEKIVVIQYN